MIPHPFTCPRCGGHRFGAITEPGPDGTVRVVGRSCHSMDDGRPFDGGPVWRDGKIRSYRRDSRPACGWRGPVE